MYWVVSSQLHQSAVYSPQSGMSRPKGTKPLSQTSTTLVGHIPTRRVACDSTDFVDQFFLGMPPSGEF